MTNGYFVVFFVVVVIAILAASASVVQAQISEIPLMPLTDPQRHNSTLMNEKSNAVFFTNSTIIDNASASYLTPHDYVTLQILSSEDKLMKIGYQLQAAGNTAGYNDAVILNNIYVCFNAAHNNDQTTIDIAQCDSMVSQFLGKINTGKLIGVPKVFIDGANLYLKLRHITQ